MAWRGGGRGGRGRGSFGGRGGGGPVARDDDGLILAPDKPDGPPKLFPPVEALPELPDLGPKDLQLLGYRRHFEQAMLGSPYHVEKPAKRLAGLEADIARYSDRYKKAKAVTRAPLSSVLKLTLAHFPGELLDTSARLKASQSSGLTPWKLQKTAGNDLQRLDQLANLEEKTEGKEGKEGEEKKKEEGEEDEEEVVEDEEEEFGENDYGETYGFEDDEEYAEMDDGDDGFITMACTEKPSLGARLVCIAPRGALWAHLMGRDRQSCSLISVDVVLTRSADDYGDVPSLTYPRRKGVMVIAVWRVYNIVEFRHCYRFIVSFCFVCFFFVFFFFYRSFVFFSRTFVVGVVSVLGPMRNSEMFYVVASFVGLALFCIEIGKF